MATTFTVTIGPTEELYVEFRKILLERYGTLHGNVKKHLDHALKTEIEAIQEDIDRKGMNIIRTRVG